MENSVNPVTVQVRMESVHPLPSQSYHKQTITDIQ